MTELEARTICIDVDWTICRCPNGADYRDAIPVPGAKEAIQELRRAGWVVVLFTARHFNHWHTTTEWLRRNGFEYDHLAFGKPPARFYVDDRAIPFKGSWDELVASLGGLADSSTSAGSPADGPGVTGTERGPHSKTTSTG